MSYSERGEGGRWRERGMYCVLIYMFERVHSSHMCSSIRTCIIFSSCFKAAPVHFKFWTLNRHTDKIFDGKLKILPRMTQTLSLYSHVRPCHYSFSVEFGRKVTQCVFCLGKETGHHLVHTQCYSFKLSFWNLCWRLHCFPIYTFSIQWIAN